MEVFVSDTVTINLDVGMDISGFSTLNIKYEKPSGAEGCWDASVCPTDNTHIVTDLTATELDENGTWKVQAYVEEGAEHYHGAVAEFTVLKRLTETCP